MSELPLLLPAGAILELCWSTPRDDSFTQFYVTVLRLVLKGIGKKGGDAFLSGEGKMSTH